MSFSAVLEIGLIVVVVVKVLVECVFSFYHCREISSQEGALVLAMVTVLMAS